MAYRDRKDVLAVFELESARTGDVVLARNRRCILHQSTGLYSYGLYSYGLYSYGLYSYGLYSYYLRPKTEKCGALRIPNFSKNRQSDVESFSLRSWLSNDMRFAWFGQCRTN